MLQEAILCQRLHHSRKVPGVFGRTMPLVDGQHLVRVHSHTSDTDIRSLPITEVSHPAGRVYDLRTPDERARHYGVLGGERMASDDFEALITQARAALD